MSSLPAARPLADSTLPGLGRVGVWFNDPSNYGGPDGLWARLQEHVVYTAIVVAVAVVIAVPLGLLIGHTGRGVLAVVGVANALRAVPTLGAVILLSTVLAPHIDYTGAIPGVVQRGGVPNLVATLIVLIVLAIPPILTNTYAGVQNVDASARDAARGMGMTQWQVVRGVELPCALPLILSGFRSAVLQVIATVAVAAYLPFLGGLGAYIAQGAGQINDLQLGYPAMVASGVVIALLAVVLDGLLALVQRYAVSPGLSGRTTRPELNSVAPAMASAHGY